MELRLGLISLLILCVGNCSPSPEITQTDSRNQAVSRTADGELQLAVSKTSVTAQETIDFKLQLKNSTNSIYYIVTGLGGGGVYGYDLDSFFFNVRVKGTEKFMPGVTMHVQYARQTFDENVLLNERRIAAVRPGESYNRTLSFTWQQFLELVFGGPVQFPGTAFEIEAEYVATLLPIGNRFSLPFLEQSLKSNLVTISVSSVP